VHSRTPCLSGLRIGFWKIMCGMFRSRGRRRFTAGLSWRDRWTALARPIGKGHLS
jgi:hypothetical protein